MGGRESMADEEELSAKIAELDQGLSSGLKAMEERMKNTEESLKVRVTQMEVAIMGALSKVSRGGGGHPSDDSEMELGSGCSSGTRKAARRKSDLNFLSSAGGVTSTRDGESGEPSTQGASAWELANVGQNVHMMQALLERDVEIRQALSQLRRQVTRSHTVRLVGGEGRGDDGDGTPRGKMSSRSSLSSLASCCVVEEAAEGKELSALRKALKLCGPVLHPDDRFRSLWNASMAVLIVYCGVAIPLEIAFENDMFYSMCALPMTTPITGLERSQCASHLAWFYFNVIVDVWFMIDVVLNLRTGYTVEGHFVSDDLMAIQHYLRGSFLFDVIGSFPLNLVLAAATNDEDNSAGRGNKLIRMIRLAKLTKLFRMIKLGRYLEYVEVWIPSLARARSLARTAWTHAHTRTHE